MAHDLDIPDVFWTVCYDSRCYPGANGVSGPVHGCEHRLLVAILRPRLDRQQIDSRIVVEGRYSAQRIRAAISRLACCAHGPMHASERSTPRRR